MDTAAILQFLLQAVHLLAWPLVVVLVVLMQSSRVARLLDACIALIWRLDSLKITGAGVEIKTFPPEEVRELPDVRESDRGTLRLPPSATQREE